MSGGRGRRLGGALVAALLAAGIAVADGGTFEATGDLVNGGRTSHAAALLEDGRVLVAGGFTSSEGDESATAEIWDPDTGEWTGTDSMAVRRQGLSANRLADGRVMVSGGIDSGSVFSSTEVWDPDGEEFSAGPGMTAARCFHATIDLPDGRIFAVGGLGGSNTALSSAEVYDPGDDEWTATDPMAAARLHFPAVVMADGRVLVVGGSKGPEGGFASLETCEIWDPDSGDWSSAASLPAVRAHSAGALLPDGRVLVVGGHDGSTSYGDALVYDPDADSWSTEATGLAERSGASLLALPDGRFLSAGGIALPSQEPLASADLYDSGTGEFTALPSMVEGRVVHTATALGDGRVLFAGGNRVVAPGVGGQTDSAELFVADEDEPEGEELSAAGPAAVWIGLKNSDDVGTKFDLLAELLLNGEVVAAGQVDGVNGGSSGFNNAHERSIEMAVDSGVTVQSGDELGFRLSVRIASTGHRSGTARLWFNDADADSRVAATIGGSTHDLYLVDEGGNALADGAGDGPRKKVDVFVDRAKNDNAFKPFGTWTRTVE